MNEFLPIDMHILYDSCAEFLGQRFLKLFDRYLRMVHQNLSVCSEYRNFFKLIPWFFEQTRELGLGPFRKRARRRHGGCS